MSPPARAPRLLALRVEAHVEVDRVHEPALLGQAQQLGGLDESMPSGFSHTTCLPAASARLTCS
jgi:hypothetical protein